MLGHENGIGHGFHRISRAGFLNDMIGTINFVMPRAAVPMVAAHEVEHAGPGDIERDVVIIGELVNEMAGIGAFIAASAVVSAAHVGARADALVRPLVPHSIGVKSNRDNWRLGVCGEKCAAGVENDEQRDKAVHAARISGEGAFRKKQGAREANKIESLEECALTGRST